MKGLSSAEYLGSFGFWQAKATLDSCGFKYGLDDCS